MSGSETEIEDDALESGTEDASTGDDDVETVEIEPSEEELSGGLFDGVDDADGDESGAESGQTGESDGSGETPAGPSVGGDALADVINEGAARLAVVGLSEQDFEEGTPDELEEELCEVFAAFRLGYFGQESIEKYVLAPSEGEIEPIWGLVGSAALAAAVALSMRPDGNAQISDMAETLNLGGD